MDRATFAESRVTPERWREVEGILQSAFEHAADGLYGLALSYLGRKDEAVREGERGVALAPLTTNTLLGPYLQHQLVRTYLLVDEPEQALDRLEQLLKVPYYLSPGWLRIDPTFDQLRRHPRFRRLLGGTA